MKRRDVILLCSLNIALAGCSSPAQEEPAPVASSAPPVSRGYEKSTVDPGAVRSPETKLAVEFVRLAATADVRLDTMPPEAVLRARDMMTPELAERVAAEKRPVDPWMSTHWPKQDAYISVEITGVLGDIPQSAPDPNEPPPRPEDGITLEVSFLRTYHHDGVKDKLRFTNIWPVTIRDGVIIEFAMDIDE